MTYLEDLAAEIEAEVDADRRPSGDTRVLFLGYAVLALSKGTSTTAPDVHDAWAAWTLVTDPSHRSLLPFEDLSADVQAEDEPFAEAIRRVAARHGLLAR